MSAHRGDLDPKLIAALHATAIQLSLDPAELIRHYRELRERHARKAGR